MPTRQDEDQRTQDDKYNPAENPSHENFSRLTHYENNAKPSFGNNTNRGEDSSQQRVANGEKRSLDSTRTGKAAVDAAAVAASAAATPLAGRVVKALGKLKTKKAGAGALAVLLVIGAILLIGGFTGPGLLLVHVVETFTEKFDTQFATRDRRTNRMFFHKLNSDTTQGLCTTAVSIRCRYSTMKVDTTVQNFKNAGIDVKYDSTTIFRGRAKPTSFDYYDRGSKSMKSVPASRFNAEMRNNPAFRQLVHNAHNPRFAGYNGWSFRNALSVFNINGKGKALNGDTDADRQKHISDTTKDPTQRDGSTTRRLTTDDTKPDGTKYTQAEIDEINARADLADSIAHEANNVATSGSKSFTRALAGAGRGVGVLGGFDTVCGVYGTIKAIGYGAKIIRAAQLVRYAWFFYNTASLIKDGKAEAADVAYLATILTTVMRDARGNVTKRSATDGFGYKYAAYGDTGVMPDSTLQFMAGGGLGGRFSSVASTINSALGGTPNKTCGVIRNPWVSGGSIAAGVLLMFIPGVNVAWSAKTIAVAAGSIIFEQALVYLTPLLTDIVAGRIIDEDNPPLGEDSGDAIASGGAELAGRTAQFSGNSAMTIDQAVQFEHMRGKIQAAYIEEERLTRSPLDPTSRYTLVGSMVANILPSMSSFTSVASSLSSFGSVLSRSISTLSPTAGAVTEDQYRRSLTMCTDPEYNDIYGDDSNQAIATSPFCNVIYGMPPEWVDIPVDEPLNVLEGQYDDVTGDPLPGSAYETFVNDCIKRSTPLGGSADIDQQQSNGTECVANDTNKWYYLAWMDRLVAFEMDGDDVQADSTQQPVQQNPTVEISGSWAKPYDGSQINSIYGGSYYFKVLGFRHMGVDLQNSMGSPVYSACDGTVLHIIREGGEDYGQQTSSNAIVVDCGGGIWSGYHHTRPVSGITEGMAVQARTLIGRSDCSGICSGAHLHFAIRINGEFTDPVPFMEERGINLGTCRPGNSYCE